MMSEDTAFFFFFCSHTVFLEKWNLCCCLSCLKTHMAFSFNYPPFYSVPWLSWGHRLKRDPWWFLSSCWETACTPLAKYFTCLFFRFFFFSFLSSLFSINVGLIHFSSPKLWKLNYCFIWKIIIKNNSHFLPSLANSKLQISDSHDEYISNIYLVQCKSL